MNCIKLTISICSCSLIFCGLVAYHGPGTMSTIDGQVNIEGYLKKKKAFYPTVMCPLQICLV